MKSIQKRFNQIVKNNPAWSSIICFHETVKDQDYSKKTIYYWFSKLVDKNDYDVSYKNELLSFVVKLSKSTEEGIKKG